MADVLVVSDFNAELASRLISADQTQPILKAEASPYGQVFQTLSQATGDRSAVAAFVWTRPEGVLPSYGDLLEGVIDTDRILAEVADFIDLILKASERFRIVLVASWTRSQNGRGAGMLDWTPDGQAWHLAQMNLRLAEAFRARPNIRLLDSQRWLEAAAPARDARYWYAMKSPFVQPVCEAAARDVKAAVRGYVGLARKLIVLDLDDTLWGGVVGEDGWQGLRLGGHDPKGEAFADFQRALKALIGSGVALGVVSKNTEAVALDAIDNHPEMVLRRKDLAGWRINWNDKAANIEDLVKGLNLGLQSVVFIDDNPTERGRVREAFPDVLVPEWPADPMRYADALRALDCFDQPALTAEDRARVHMYAQERERTDSRQSVGSMDDWLQSLGVEVMVEPVTAGNLVRAVQLANKTNQMNLRTRRFTEAEFLTWLAEGERRAAKTLKVADRFGDIGLAGLVSWEQSGDVMEITDYVLSCRAMGRKVENLMAYLAIEAGRAAGARWVRAALSPTARNLPCREFWLESGFTEAGENLFQWDLSKPYDAPAFITVEPRAQP